MKNPENQNFQPATAAEAATAHSARKISSSLWTDAKRAWVRWAGAAAVCAAVFGGGGEVRAVDYIWTQNSATTQDWTVAGNWNANGVFQTGTGSGLTFFSDTTTILVSGNNTIGSVPTALTMNTLTLNGKANGSASSNVTIATNASTWTLGGTTPTVTLNGVNNSKSLIYDVASQITLGADTLFTGNGNSTFKFSGNITGAYSITKTGTSSLTLSNVANTYTGGTTIKEGTLVILGVGGSTTITNLGSGTIYLGDATGSTSANIQMNNNNTVGNAIVVQGLGGTKSLSITGGATAVYSGGITLNDNLSLISSAVGSYISISTAGVNLNDKTLTFNSNGTNAGTITVSSVISGTGNLVFGGSTSAAGKFRLSGDNTFNGTATINPSSGGGNIVLELNHGNALKSATLNTGSTGNQSVTFVVSGNNTYNVGALTGSDDLAITNSNTLSVGAKAVDTTFSGNLTGSGNFTKTGSNSLTLDGSANTYSGITTVNGGTLNVGGTLASTTVNITAGSLVLGSDNRLSASAAVNVSGTGTLAMGAHSNSVGIVTLTAGNISGTGGTLTGTSYAVESGSISAKLGGSGIALTKSTAGTVTLSAANTYTGATTVSAGTLVISSGASISLSSSTVNGGVLSVDGTAGTVVISNTGTLKGSGTVGAVTVNSGGTLSPGNSPGTLTQGSTTFAGGGNYNWQIIDALGSAGTGYDTITLTAGSVLDITATSGNPFKLNLWSLSSIGPDVNGNANYFNAGQNYSWTLVSTDQAITGFSTDKFSIYTTANNGAGGFSNPLDGGSFAVALADGGTDLVLNYTAVPEPKVWGLITFGLCFTLFRFRARQRRVGL